MRSATDHTPEWLAAMRIAQEAWRLRYGVDVQARAMKCVVRRRNDNWVVEASPSPVAVVVTPKRDGKRIYSERRTISSGPIGTFSAEIAADGRVVATAHND